MIVTEGSRLTQPCQLVETNEGLDIVDKLELELKASRQPGMGLAANQIGLLKRVCILRIPNWDNKLPAVFGYNLLNPTIIKKKYPLVVKNEGCLSYPGKMVQTLRYDEIVVEDALEPLGRLLTGWAAVCCQHEVDHLNGITMYMRQHKDIKPTSPCPCDSNKQYQQCCQKELKKTNRVME